GQVRQRFEFDRGPVAGVDDPRQFERRFFDFRLETARADLATFEFGFGDEDGPVFFRFLFLRRFFFFLFFAFFFLLRGLRPTGGASRPDHLSDRLPVDRPLVEGRRTRRGRCFE